MASNLGMKVHLTPKELGQLKSLKAALGNWTRYVIEWMVDPINWFRFCQHVRHESKLPSSPPHPSVGFLLSHKERGLRLMRSELRNSPGAAEFVRQLDQQRYQQLKTLLNVYADGEPERLVKIDAAKTLLEVQVLFVGILDEDQAAAAQQLSFHVQPASDCGLK